MRSRSLCLTPVLCLLASSLLAATAASDVSGEWEMTTMVLGNPLAERVTFTVDKGKLTGTSSGRPVTGTVNGDRVRFETKDQDGTVNTYEGQLQDRKLSGTVTVSQEPWGSDAVADVDRAPSGGEQARGAADSRLPAEGLPPRLLRGDRARAAHLARRQPSGRARSTRAASTR
jgi:hypothetical protein